MTTFTTIRDLHCMPIADANQISEARRLAVGVARGLEFGEDALGKVALVATEMATNLVRHAHRGGELLVREIGCGGIGGIELLALDKGPGIGDVGKALRDGYSTSGSPGTGLGAISRLSALFDIHSTPGVGTAVMARLWTGARPKTLVPRELEIGAVSVPKPGEKVCGDSWAADEYAGRGTILLADGLGHGADAAHAAGAAVRTFRNRPRLAPGEMIEAIHGALLGTRGAAVFVAEIDTVRQVVRSAGVGNIAAAVLSPQSGRHLVSHSGTVGLEVRRVQEFSCSWHTQALLALHSDGLMSRWNLDAYPGLAQRHPCLIASVLYRDFTRRSDDVTVLVTKGMNKT